MMLPAVAGGFLRDAEKTGLQGTLFVERGLEALCITLNQERAFIPNSLGGEGVFTEILDAEGWAGCRVG